MTVSRNFSELNIHPNKGWVTSIDLYDPYPLFGGSGHIGSSKRKSCHVPNSSNAYWNYVNLRSQVVAWESRQGIIRDDRRLFERALNGCVRFCHAETIRSDNERQYFNVTRNSVFGGMELVIRSVNDINTEERNDKTNFKPIQSVFVSIDGIVTLQSLEISESDLQSLREANFRALWK